MKAENLVRVVVACTVSLAAGGIGLLVVPRGRFASWYAQLRKPAFTPPDWVFGPVWTVLYSLMGVAASLVWKEGLGRRPTRVALLWFLGQLVLNALWTPVFFGLRRIGSALAIIGLLWAALAVTVCRFVRVSRAAGLLLVPYLLWVSFAAILNASIWWLNPRRTRLSGPAASLGSSGIQGSCLRARRDRGHTNDEMFFSSTPMNRRSRQP
jgi:benzodiazapine receptor